MDIKAVNNCWVRVDKDHGEGDGSYKLIYEANKSDVPQTAVIEVASEDGTIVREISITQSPRKVYQSAMKQKIFRKNDCMSDQKGTEVLYVVPSGKYTSYISQEDADAQAEKDLNENGQDYANAEGDCTTYVWYNDEMSVVKTKNDCSTGVIGSDVTYTVRAGKYNSFVSKEDANRKAQEDLDENAQKYANDNGTCPDLYYSKRVEGDFTKNNCPSGQVPSAPIHYVVEAGAFTSSISQEDADAKAQAELQVKGQAKANSEGTCSSVYWNVEKSGSFQKNDCEEGVGSIVVYKVPANTISSTISQVDADAKAAQKVQDEGQAYANENGTCSSTTTYSSKEVRVTQKKNDCEEGSVGTDVEYVVEAGKYTSTISQADADAKAEKDASDNSQAYANEHGTCTPSSVYQNSEIRTTLTRNNCTEGSGGEATYVVPAGKYTSTISQADADAQAQADSDANAQNWVNENAECILHFVNVEKSQSFNKNDCDGGMKGTAVVYTVEAGKYASIVSQEDADAKAQADIDANGQNYANEHGQCVDVYLSQEIREKVQKNDCDSGMVGSEVEYIVEAGKYTSDISQADADAQAQADFDENAQSYANKNGHCVYANVEKRQTFTRNDCGEGYEGTSVEYVVPAGKYTSEESQEAADALADADVEANGQNNANQEGECLQIFYNVEKSGQFTPECSGGQIADPYTYTVPAGKYQSTISQADADSKADADIAANGQREANENGECRDLYLSVEKRGTFYRDDCGSCHHGAPYEYVCDAGKYTSSISQADADAQAQADVDANGQAAANKNGSCVADSTDPSWTDTGSTRCNGCSSQKEVKDTNPCSSSYNETQWVDGGGEDCSDYVYYGEGDCVGHTQYDAYQDNCSGDINYIYSVSCENCCNCGSYGDWQENGCNSSNNATKYVRFDECGNADYKEEFVDGSCGYVRCDMDLDTSAVSAGADGGSFSRSGTSVGGSSVSASSDSEWCTVSVSQNSDSFTVNITCSANDSSSERSATITVENGCNTMSIGVSQEAKSAEYVFTTSEDTVNFGNDGITGTSPLITSAKDGSWIDFTVDSQPSWIKYVIPGTPTESNNVNLTIMAEKNTSPSSRSGDIVLAQNESGLTITISLSQAGTSAETGHYVITSAEINNCSGSDMVSDVTATVIIGVEGCESNPPERTFNWTLQRNGDVLASGEFQHQDAGTHIIENIDLAAGGPYMCSELIFEVEDPSYDEWTC